MEGRLNPAPLRETVAEPTVIARRLRKSEPKSLEVQTLDETAIAALPGPVVILGDPGLGKSTLTQMLGKRGSNLYVRAGTFVRSKSPIDFLPDQGGRLVIDGLDEVASTAIGGGVDAVLGQLSAIGNPHFILSSREADWHGASARVRIEDDYGDAVSILHLEPFSRDEAGIFLQAFFPQIDAEAVLDHLAACGLEEIYKNPLTLRMIGEIARTETSLPVTRAELLESACILMLKEENPRHQDSSHALCSDKDLLLAAGAICASLLLSDRLGIFTGSTAKTPDSFLHLSSVKALPLAEAAADALKTRLFQADGESRFIANHRVIAEYLGARWLAACFDQGASERRLRTIIMQSGGVPTSLRGLNAWLAHFSNALSPGCIAADPYGVLRYGNAETLPFEQARILLHELAELSSQDPYFRAEDWNRHPAAGLMRIELKTEISTLLSNVHVHTHLVFLLLEAMVGSSIAGLLTPDLRRLLLNPDRIYGARSRTADVVKASGTLTPVGPIVEQLLALGDNDSQRLAFEVLVDSGLASMPAPLAIETLLAHAGLTVSSIKRREHKHSIYVPRNFFAAPSGPQLHAFLDQLAHYADLFAQKGSGLPQDAIADIAYTGILTAMDGETPVAPEQIWRWLGWVRHYQGYNTNAGNELRQRLGENVNLRRAIQAKVLLDAPPGEVRLRAFALRDISIALVPSDDDVIALIETFSVRTDGAPNLMRLREIVSEARTHAGLAAKVRRVALKVGGGDLSLRRDIDKWSKPFVNKGEREAKRRHVKADAERRKAYQQVRAEHAVHATAIRAGDFRWLRQTAGVYLGSFSSEFSDNGKPEVRVAQLLGPELASDVLDGFMASLHRADLPSAAGIAKCHAENYHFNIEIVLVCGVAEMVRRGLALDAVPPLALDTAYMAWRRRHESNVVGGVEIGPALEALVLTNEAQAETFFRTSIEPQLGARRTHVYDLYFLTHYLRWSALAGRLATDWLTQHENLPLEIET